MSDWRLDDRKAAILRALVSHYVRSGEPVGSKTLVDRFDLGVSPATVRNEMGALEGAGFIYQPHTSAGRVPTDAGYRYFVDAFASRERLPAPEARRIRRFFGRSAWELEDALRQTASLLSRLTDHAAVVFAPALDRSVVRHVELVGLLGGRAMFVIVTDTGRVENHVILVSEDMDEVQLERTAEMLNRVVSGAALEDAAAAIEATLERFPLELRDAAANVVTVLKDEVARHEGERIFLEGTSNIVDEDKFADLETVRQVIGALEHRRVLLELLADVLGDDRMAVRIGSENPIAEMQLCSVVTAAYGAEGHAIGSVAVVGPTRMDYRHTIPAVNEVAFNLGRLIGSSESD